MHRENPPCGPSEARAAVRPRNARAAVRERSSSRNVSAARSISIRTSTSSCWRASTRTPVRREPTPAKRAAGHGKVEELEPASSASEEAVHLEFAPRPDDAEATRIEMRSVRHLARERAPGGPRLEDQQRTILRQDSEATAHQRRRVRAVGSAEAQEELR